MIYKVRIYNVENIVSSINGVDNWTATSKIMKLDHFLTPYTKINLKWIKELNVRPENIKLIEENIGNTIFDISLSNIFLHLSPQERETKKKIKK